MITHDDFSKVDIRVGTVLSVTPYPEGKYSTHILQIDFGSDIGKKKSLARLKPRYSDHELIGKQVLAVVNFPPKQVGKHISEVLTLGVPDAGGNAILLHPGMEVPIGGRLF
jgi:tRNA-binding protein